MIEIDIVGLNQTIGLVISKHNNRITHKLL